MDKVHEYSKLKYKLLLTCMCYVYYYVLSSNKFPLFKL
jgi:hypothetical protein